ncbi:hypothetical protein L596_004439 [Steinernema carpocapsae]|uniref:Uncharacterized protein n=1 Tax=Steinernema carpocapsae TaxID=34508 RepID=A0A4U8UZE4_STECR|nr:hypothetical protein L596_004439 [Steinernema carpocapsae]
MLLANALVLNRSKLFRRSRRLSQSLELVGQSSQLALSRMALSAARGVTQVMNRCEDAKSSGFLDLSNCSLMYIADAIYLVLKGHNITKCSLKNNSLKKFPKKMIDRFPGMMIFNMEGNELEEAPEELSSWVSMKGINFAHNKLIRFPEQLYAMKELSFLDLSGNPIEGLPYRRGHALLRTTALAAVHCQESQPSRGNR